MSFIQSHSHQLLTAIFVQGFLLLYSTIAKTLSFAENFDFAPASGPIETRQFFKFQARARPEKLEPGCQLGIRCRWAVGKAL